MEAADVLELLYPESVDANASELPYNKSVENTESSSLGSLATPWCLLFISGCGVDTQ